MATVRGGKKLEKALADLAKRVSKPGTLEVGFLENATYPDGTSVAAVAAFNEFGTRTSPPRPFMRKTVADHEKEWGPEAGKLLVANNYDAPKTLALMGERIKGQIQQSITELTAPPNAPSTIAGKGHDKPLIGGPPTGGHMLNSVDYDVKT